MKHPFKQDDRIVLVEPFQLIGNKEPDYNGDYNFETCNVTPEMLEELEGWADEDGDLKFYDFPWTWPVKVISHLYKEPNKQIQS